MPAPITSSPLSAWLTYTCTAFDITTQSSTGSYSFDTRAWSGWDWSGSRRPTIDASTEVCPAAASATAPARIVPREVSTPSTRPASPRTNPVTSQCSMRSTPSRSAAEAYPHATLS